MASTHWRRAWLVGLWVLTILAAGGIGIAGLTKFFQAERWERLFLGWGYPAWVTPIVGVVEVAGALALLVPSVAAYAAMLLSVVMLGACITLLTHPGGPLGWGATPLAYLIVLLVIAVGRTENGARGAADSP